MWCRKHGILGIMWANSTVMIIKLTIYIYISQRNFKHWHILLWRLLEKPLALLKPATDILPCNLQEKPPALLKPFTDTFYIVVCERNPQFFYSLPLDIWPCSRPATVVSLKPPTLPKPDTICHVVIRETLNTSEAYYILVCHNYCQTHNCHMHCTY